jgi:inosose dehydratase
MLQNRRQFMGTLAASTAAAWPQNSPQNSTKGLIFSSNQYAWHTFYARQQRDWNANLDASLAEYTQSGLTAYEPGFGHPDEVTRLIPLMQKHGLSMPSAYVNSTLHEASKAAESIQRAIAIAEAGKVLGLKVLVTNPDPLRWGASNELKTDAQLAEQLRNLNALGETLHQRGITLAYHTHDMEMYGGAREFHHMMLNTNPRFVSFCLDAHWVYRGTGNSQVALFDIVKMYGKRIVELHIRQSVGGVWSETLTDGDIDYGRLARELRALRVRPLLVLEQCIEAQTPHTLEALEAHQRDLAYAQQIFTPLF